MRNVTITLHEDVADWLKLEAAKAGQSMSAFVSDMLENRMGRGPEAIAALEKFLSGPGFPGISANWPKRDEIYDRYEHSVMSRHERRGVRDRQLGPDQAENRGGFAEDGNQRPLADPKSTKPE